MKYLIVVGATAILIQKVCETQDEAQYEKRDSNEYYQLSTYFAPLCMNRILQNVALV